MLMIMYRPTLLLMYFNGKGKGHPRTGHEGLEGKWIYRSTLSLIVKVEMMGVQRHPPAALPQGKTLYPSYRRLCEL